MLFNHDQAIVLSDIYFKIQNYNLEAKRTRDTLEHFASLPDGVPLYPAALQDQAKYESAKERFETLDKVLTILTESLEKELIELESINWFKDR